MKLHVTYMQYDKLLTQTFFDPVCSIIIAKHQ